MVTSLTGTQQGESSSFLSLFLTGCRMCFERGVRLIESNGIDQMVLDLTETQQGEFVFVLVSDGTSDVLNEE